MAPATIPYRYGSAAAPYDAWIAQLARAEQRQRGRDDRGRDDTPGRVEQPHAASVRGNPPLDGDALSAGHATLERVLGC
ncbi:MAG: hypothetical protein ACR2HD_09270 [Solirubrobacteraceae bacterium]|nr:MAG: hypothetical protein DLM63_05270 [Solirubrobacterales bacterium]